MEQGLETKENYQLEKKEKDRVHDVNSFVLPEMWQQVNTRRRRKTTTPFLTTTEYPETIERETTSEQQYTTEQEGTSIYRTPTWSPIYTGSSTYRTTPTWSPTYTTPEAPSYDELIELYNTFKQLLELIKKIQT